MSRCECSTTENARVSSLLLLQLAPLPLGEIWARRDELTMWLVTRLLMFDLDADQIFEFDGIDD